MIKYAKKVAAILFLYAICMSILFGLIAFYNLSTNPADWSKDARFLFVDVGFFTLIACALIGGNYE